MADPNNGGGTGRSLGGGQNNEPLPSSWSRSTNSGPRIGRIGNWSGSNAQYVEAMLLMKFGDR